MPKKSFKDSTRSSVASVFMSKQNPQEDTQQETQEVIQETKQEVIQDKAQQNAQQDTQEVACNDEQVKSERRTVRTQGRKGKKKPRINMAFEPDIYEYIQKRAVKEDKSLTQYVNDVLYEKMMAQKKRYKK